MQIFAYLGMHDSGGRETIAVYIRNIEKSCANSERVPKRGPQLLFLATFPSHGSSELVNFSELREQPSIPEKVDFSFFLEATSS